MSDLVEIFTDGACRGNPGPGGWAALLRFGDTEKLVVSHNIDWRWVKGHSGRRENEIVDQAANQAIEGMLC